jgi:outer membrane protein assembly factor BamE (lipoprotein component of BamABCDE complex)
MRSAILSITALLLVSASTGCGSGLKSKNVRTLQLGQTTEKQIRGMFGKPKVVDARSDGTGRTLMLRNDHVGGAMIAFYRLADIRYLTVDLLNDRLRGYLFASTAGGDATKINKAALAALQAGMTRDEVLRLLGEPAGRALPGTILDDYKDAFGPRVAEISAWTMVEGATGVMWGNVTVRLLLVKFDASGRVVETATRAVRQS